MVVEAVAVGQQHDHPSAVRGAEPVELVEGDPQALADVGAAGAVDRVDGCLDGFEVLGEGLHDRGPGGEVDDCGAVPGSSASTNALPATRRALVGSFHTIEPDESNTTAASSGLAPLP